MSQATRFVLLLAMFLSDPRGSVRAEAPVAPASRPAAEQARLDRLLRDLSHPGFRTRSAAQSALCELPAGQLGLLVETYKSRRDHEVRLGLRAAIEHAFYRQQLQGRMGFLGLEPYPESHIFDPSTGRAIDAILVRRVLPDFPAEAAGIKTGDVILEFEGKPIGEVTRPVAARPAQPVRQINNAGVMQFVLPNPPQIKAFTAEVSRREPGSKVRMRLLRCRARDRQLVITLPERPARTLEGAEMLLVSVPQVVGVPGEAARASTRYGLCFARVTANSPAANLGFQAGDVIVAIGRMPLSPNVTPDQIVELLGQSAPGTEVVMTVSHLEQVELTVTLGGRPVDRMNPEDMEIAQARFAEWWKEQTGEPSLRTPPALFRLGEPNRPGTGLPDPTLLP